MKHSTVKGSPVDREEVFWFMHFKALSPVYSFILTRLKAKSFTKMLKASSEKIDFNVGKL